MKELFVVLKATMAGAMDVLRVKKRIGKRKLSGNLLVLLLTFVLMYVFGTYAYMMAEPLNKVDLTSLMIVIFALVSTILVFVQGVYRSEGILFGARDNDLLFSMPIKRKTIFATRLIKLTLFEYIWTFISMVPAFAVYAYFEKPQFAFYITALIIFITIPIIPIIMASIIAYLIQGIASRFKFKRITQILFNFIFVFGIMALSINLQKFMTGIAENARSISDFIYKIYYPMGLYEECITNFNAMKLAMVLGINILIFLIYIYLFSLTYFNIISKLSEKHSSSNYRMRKLKVENQNKALLKKELKRYFSSPAYIMNTIFGEVLLVIAAVYVIFSQDKLQSIIASEMGSTISLKYMPVAVMIFTMFTIAMSNVTASSISMEGKSLWITKSLPVSEKRMFLSKMCLSWIITVPLSVISLLIFAIKLKFSTFYFIAGIIEIIVVSLWVSIFGLIINLKYPKLNARSDTEVVKQSMSSMISVYAGMILVAIPIMLYFVLKCTNLELFISMTLVAIALFVLILWKVLMKYGVKKFRELN